jgi:valyl-tRNA synthetase
MSSPTLTPANTPSTPIPSQLPTKYDPQEAEARWRNFWEEAKVYAWDPSAPRDNTFVVDTPPPTASGRLHIGHIFSYTHTDVLVRYQRMTGKNIFYPIGWDDNGLPTERRVQNYLGIKCDPRLPYDPSWKPTPLAANNTGKDAPLVPVSRRNFIEACALVTKEDEVAFENTFRRAALSFDWSTQYETINADCRKISQLSFLDLLEKKLLHNIESPTMWDSDFGSAVAQAEIEDREVGGAFYDIRFGVEGGGEFTVATTRPELLPACIAVVAHPSDKRYQHLFGKRAITPLFQAPVPILPAEHADPEKGSGILMVCTFGDIMDVNFWKQSGLPLKQVIGTDGKLCPVQFGTGPFASLAPEQANAAYGQLQGLYVKQAHKKIAELLAGPTSFIDSATRALIGEPKPITHPVKFYEKGERPIEFVPTRQWFIKILEYKEALIAQGKKIQWHPSHMLNRYENWVKGLNQDWCISRQRYFGVPFPVWYPITATGVVQYDKPIFAKPEALPVDPLSDLPSGYKEEQRDKPNGFTGDPDVMDTWATSALTPQIESKWLVDEKRHKKLFPMDLRPQAHDIIRTWAFYTIVKAWMHEGEIPWKNAAISGFVTDPDRKKMSKSKGNVVTPEDLLREHSSDAIRYWASRARLGIDSALDPAVFQMGRKLITKIFNASRFVLMQFERAGVDLDQYGPREITAELDKALVAKLHGLIEDATKSQSAFEFGAALQSTEDAFWSYCDNYLELVKVRSYTDNDTAGRRSAFATLSWSLKTFLRLFAPTLPYVTEEVWSFSFAKSTKGTEARERSIHRALWPSTQEIAVVPAPLSTESLAIATDVLGKVRGTKTAAQKNLRWIVDQLTIETDAKTGESLTAVIDDIAEACNVRSKDAVKVTAGGSGGVAVQVVLSATET